MTLEELRSYKITPVSEEIRRKIKENWDRVAKPLDGLGIFEELLAQIGAVHGTEEIDIAKKAIVVMCADNGIVAERVSQSGQEVTASVAKMMGQNRSSVGKMAERANADVIPVDIGINSSEKFQGVRSMKLRMGTADFYHEPAMEETEALDAIAAGIEIAKACKKQNYRLIGLGEMGIGNTTTSSAVAAALFGCDPQNLTGRGAGLDDAGLRRKCRIIRESLKRYDFRKEETLRILRTVGGLDIAGLAGVCIGGAYCHIPVVLDGLISSVAALVASRFLPEVKGYLIASHAGREPAIRRILKELELSPVLCADMALGEGTGAAMMFALLDMAAAVYEAPTTFSDVQIEQYRRFEETGC